MNTPNQSESENDLNAVFEKIQELAAKSLEYLCKHHGISTRTIYNNLHGFIRNQSIHQETYIAFYKEATQPREDDSGFDRMDLPH